MCENISWLKRQFLDSFSSVGSLRSPGLVPDGDRSGPRQKKFRGFELVEVGCGNLEGLTSLEALDPENTDNHGFGFGDWRRR